MSTLVSLFRGLHSQLVTLLAPVPVERRYAPRRDAKDLVDLKVAIYMETTTREEIARGVIDNETFVFGIAVQKAAAPQDGATDTEGNPIWDGFDNLVYGDAVIDQMESIKDLWRANGPLRDLKIANCTFETMVHDPLYEPIHLAVMGVYSSILDVTYRVTGG